MRNNTIIAVVYDVVWTELKFINNGNAERVDKQNCHIHK